MNYKNFISIFLVCLIPLASYAQRTKVISDFRTIVEAEISKSVFKNWEMVFEPKMTLEKNSSRLDDILLNLQLGYSPYKFISFGAGYGHIFVLKNNYTYEHRQKISALLSIRYKINRMRFDYRLCYQNMDDDFLQSGENYSARNIIRNRVRFKYNLPDIRLLPYSSIEHFSELSKTTIKGLKFRYLVGFEYPLFKRQSIRLYFRIDHEQTKIHPFTYYNAGFSYSLQF